MQAGSSIVVRRGRTFIIAALALGAVAGPTVASAHLERPSYWPDPAVDQAGGEPTGGKVPKARSLGSAITGKGPGQVRVVCKDSSLNLAEGSIAAAHDRGFRLRPSQPKKKLSDQKAQSLLDINRELAQMCSFHSIQTAVDESGNNDRVVIMPGRYTEPKSRKQPTNDPRCADMTQDNGSGGMAPSYAYQVKCSNDQNLIYVQGRKVPKNDPPPEPPLAEREGIPDLGPCVRCNFQIEGSGAKPTDVIMDAGTNYKRKTPNSKPGVANDCDFQPECAYAKDVVLRVDRADGFVGRNFLTKSSTEHGLYIEETDGYFVDKTKFFWSAEYGNLTFTSDHGLYKNCDAYAAGDAAIYPGAAPETGEGVEDTDFYPDAPRINTVVKKCDMRSSALAYSGSQGNAVRITHNEIYGNTSGVVSDSASASGHPGYPPDSIVIDHNNIYSNNLDSYGEDSPFVNTVGLPIGVGIVWPGVNKSTVHHNHIFDNWLRGTMLFGIPEGLTRGTPEDPSPQGSCPGNPVVMTSCENEYHHNVMGQAPPGFKPSPAVDKFGNPSSLDGDQINGVDFWWDEFPGNEGNCWHDNEGSDPEDPRGSLTADPPIGPAEGVNTPLFLPEACAASDPTYPLGIRVAPNAAKEAELIACAGLDDPEAGPCPWFETPPEPGTPRAAAAERESKRAARELEVSDAAVELDKKFRELSTIARRR
ncbi:MAG: hypothetical protein QOI31_862 [Solirubrobacterales bacterium]|nr:hypothetical protein [Solirubrobacterales bacterium]